MRPTGAENDGGLRRPVRETDFVDVVAGRPSEGAREDPGGDGTPPLRVIMIHGTLLVYLCVCVQCACCLQLTLVSANRLRHAMIHIQRLNPFREPPAASSDGGGTDGGAGVGGHNAEEEEEHLRREQVSMQSNA